MKKYIEQDMHIPEWNVVPEWLNNSAFATGSRDGGKGYLATFKAAAGQWLLIFLLLLVVFIFVGI